MEQTNEGWKNVLEVLLDIRDQNEQVIDLLQKPPVEIAGKPIEGLTPECPHRDCPKVKYHDCPVHGRQDDMYRDEPPEKDELFDLAAETIRTRSESRYINANHLHQVMGISYGRASSLIDQLEAAGVITAPDKNGRRRVV